MRHDIDKLTQGEYVTAAPPVELNVNRSRSVMTFGSLPLDHCPWITAHAISPDAMLTDQNRGNLDAHCDYVKHGNCAARKVRGRWGLLETHRPAIPLVAT